MQSFSSCQTNKSDTKLHFKNNLPFLHTHFASIVIPVTVCVLLPLSSVNNALDFPPCTGICSTGIGYLVVWSVKWLRL